MTAKLTRTSTGAPRFNFCPVCGRRLAERAEADGAIRQVCRSCGWVHYPHAAISVSAVAVQDGRVLLVRRRNRPFPGTWMFPSGFVEYGEVPEEAVLRELREETGLHAEVGALLAMRRSTDDPREPNHLVLFFAVHSPRGELRNEPSENLATAWFPIDALPEIELVHHREIASELGRAPKAAAERHSGMTHHGVRS